MTKSGQGDAEAVEGVIWWVVDNREGGEGGGEDRVYG